MKNRTNNYFLLIIVSLILVLSCSENAKKDSPSKQENPSIILEKARESRKLEKFNEAILQYEEILIHHKQSAEVDIAKVEVEAAKKEKAIYDEKISKEDLIYFKNIKEYTTIESNGIKYAFSSFSTGKEFRFDSYGNSSMYRTAERGSKYISFSLKVTSSSKEPKLLPVMLYRFENKSSELSYVGDFEYEFAKWTDYGHYLGNYHEKRNDFKYSESVSFKLGYEVLESTLNGHALFIIVNEKACVERKRFKLESPPVKYEYSCTHKDILNKKDFENGSFKAIKVLNKKNL